MGVKARKAWQMGKVQEGLAGKGMDFLAVDPSFGWNIPAANIGD